MGFTVDFEQLFEVHVRVFLGCRQALVTEEFLDGPQVGSPAEKVGSKGMAQGMGADFPPGRGDLDVFVHNPLN